MLDLDKALVLADSTPTLRLRRIAELRLAAAAVLSRTGQPEAAAKYGKDGTAIQAGVEAIELLPGLLVELRAAREATEALRRLLTPEDAPTWARRVREATEILAACDKVTGEATTNA